MNVCEHWDITETNNLIRFVIFDENSSFLFSQPVPEHLIDWDNVYTLQTPNGMIIDFWMNFEKDND